MTFRVRSASAVIRYTLAALLSVAAVHPSARAQGGCVNGGSGACAVPEIEPGLANGSVALLGGMLLVLRARNGGGRK